ncbi:MAG: T9SS type A sorting domain-containing protein [Flavipsychrobacter sp.]
MSLLLTPAKAQYNNVASYPFTATSSQTLTYLASGTSANILADDRTESGIPIGFTFYYAGIPYTTVSACSNGWVAFGNTTSTTYSNTKSNMDNLTPVLMPLFDDLTGGRTGAQATYTTTGVAGSRVFTFEWRDWTPLSSSSVKFTFQLKLYEGQGNEIEFLYKNEAGSGTLSSATIGISGIAVNDYQMLTASSASPSINKTSFVSNIRSVPATGQSYKWDNGPICDKPITLTVAALNSTSATFTWVAPVGVQNYEYYIDQQAGINLSAPTAFTTNNNIVENGLTPSTQYWLHIRRHCSTDIISFWESIDFTTLPPCTEPPRINVTSVTTSAVNFGWNSIATALSYEYVIDNSKNTPTSGSTIVSTTSNFVNRTGLTSGTTYYVHIRSLCAGKDSSAWMLDSFYVPRPCVAPTITITDVNTSRSVVSWQPVITANEYEYVITSTATPPAIGTKIKNSSVFAPYLNSGTPYYAHVRCHCIDRDVESISNWSTKKFDTFPLSVNGLNGKATSITVYPNPVKDVLQIEVADVRGVEAYVQLLDVAGKVLMQHQVTSAKLQFDMSKLPSGLYLLKYHDEQRNELIKVNKQ